MGGNFANSQSGFELRFLDFNMGKCSLTAMGVGGKDFAQFKLLVNLSLFLGKTLG